MPTITVPRDYLFTRLGRSYSDPEFENLCFEFGIELDDVTTEKEIVSKQGMTVDEKANNNDIEETVYKIEIPANRYDLLCLEGLVIALRVFLGLEEPPRIKILPPATNNGKPLQIIQSSSTHSIRPFVVGCVLRNFTFNPRNFKSFIDLQDKLHQNIGRKRTLVAIGTHDLDTIEGPFRYEAKSQESIEFIALRESKSMNVKELFSHFHSIPHHPLLPYLAITENAEFHPVIYDKNNIVLSLPPIINGEHSKISLSTKNILIECTGTDSTKLSIALNTMIAMFSCYCEKPFTVESVEIVQENNSSNILSYPILKEEIFTTNVDYLNRGIGIELNSDELVKMLNKMQLRAHYDDKTSSLIVATPITRSDILHAVDIMEDVAIAYGYNRIARTVPKTYTVARPNLINKLTDLNREIVAQAGFTEVLTWALCSHADCYVGLNREDSGSECVRIGNSKLQGNTGGANDVPRHEELKFEIVRVSILPGLLKALASNSGIVPLPIRIFEISDVAFQTRDSDVGARNRRMLGALYCGTNSGYELIHGLLDRVLMMNNYVSQAHVNEQTILFNKRAAEKAKVRAKIAAERAAAAKKAAKNAKKGENKEAKEATPADEAEEEDGEESTFTYNSSRVYRLERSENPTYFPGRRADVYVGTERVATFGILHPKVLSSFQITYPCSALELNVEFFLDLRENKQ